MEMKYEIKPDYTMDALEFTGLTGDEVVFSVKEALNFLTVENPAGAFAESVKNGAYSELSDAKYEQVVETMRAVAGLFRYDAEDKDALREMNVVMLLKNAILELVKRDVMIRKLQKNNKIT